MQSFTGVLRQLGTQLMLIQADGTGIALEQGDRLQMPGQLLQPNAIIASEMPLYWTIPESATIAHAIIPAGVSPELWAIAYAQHQSARIVRSDGFAKGCQACG